MIPTSRRLRTAGKLPSTLRDVAHSRAAVVATIAAALAGSSAFGWWLGEQRRAANDAERATVVEVIDGDTVVVRTRDGATDLVRLLGVDTPETVHPTEGVECFGPEASAYLAARLAGQTVRLENDVERRDRYDRRLAYVYLDGVRINDELLELGYARLLVIDPNRAHARDMLRAELDAKSNDRGVWAEC